MGKLKRKQLHQQVTNHHHHSYHHHTNNNSNNNHRITYYNHNCTNNINNNNNNNSKSHLHSSPSTLSSPSCSPSSSSLSPTSPSLSSISSQISPSSRASSPSSNSPWKSPLSLYAISDEDSGMTKSTTRATTASASSTSSSPSSSSDNSNQLNLITKNNQLQANNNPVTKVARFNLNRESNRTNIPSGVNSNVFAMTNGNTRNIANTATTTRLSSLVTNNNNNHLQHLNSQHSNQQQQHHNHLLHQQNHQTNKAQPFSKRTLNVLPPPPTNFGTSFSLNHHSSHNNNVSSNSTLLSNCETSIPIVSTNSNGFVSNSIVELNRNSLIPMRQNCAINQQNSIHNHLNNSNMMIMSSTSSSTPSSASASIRNSQKTNLSSALGTNTHHYNQNSTINNRSAPCAYPSRSKNNKYELKILSQPEDQHRARYLTEGSRGAIKDKSGHGYPIVKLCGYTRQPIKIQCFIGHDKHIGVPHLFYQASKIAGKNSTNCIIKKIDGTSIITMEASPANNMEVNVDCIGILKERNVDVEQKLNKFQKSSNNNSNNVNTSTNDSDTVANIKRSTRCRLVFRCEIPETMEILQTVSTPILCTQPLGTPEINKKSLSYSNIEGGEELFIIGKNFLKDAKVIFRNDKWIKIVEPNREYLKSTHLICKIPPYDLSSLKLSQSMQTRSSSTSSSSSSLTTTTTAAADTKLIEVLLMVKSGGKCSDSQKFYYRIPDNVNNNNNNNNKFNNNSQQQTSNNINIRHRRTESSNSAINNAKDAVTDFMETRIKLEATDLQSSNDLKQSQMMMTNSVGTTSQPPSSSSSSLLCQPMTSFNGNNDNISAAVISNNDQINNSKDLINDNDLNKLGSSENLSVPLVCNNPLIASSTSLALNDSIAVPETNTNTTNTSTNATNENTLILDLNAHHDNLSLHHSGHHQFIDHHQNHLQSTTSTPSATHVTVVDSNQTHQSIQQQQMTSTNSTNANQPNNNNSNNLYSMLNTSSSPSSSASSMISNDINQSNHHSNTIIQNNANLSSSPMDSTTIMSFMSNQNMNNNTAMNVNDTSLTSPSSTNTLSTSPAASVISSSSVCSVPLLKQDELVDNIIHGCTVNNNNNNNLNNVNTNVQTASQVEQCSSASMGTNIITEQQLQYINHQNLLNQTSCNSGNNNANVHFTQTSMIATQQPENISTSLQSILQSNTDLTNSSNVSLQVVTQVPVAHSIQQKSSSAFMDHPMSNVKNDKNMSPPRMTSNPVSATATTIDNSLPEISLQDLNKQLNAISQPVVCPVQNIVHPAPSSSLQTSGQSNTATNMTMAMEGVLDGSFQSNKLAEATNQLPSLIMNASMLNNTNNSTSSVTIMNPQQSIVTNSGSDSLLNRANNQLSDSRLALSNSDFQMMNLQTAPSSSDFIVQNSNNNTPIIDTIMSNLVQTNANAANVTAPAANPTATIDSFMQSLPVTNTDNLSNMACQQVNGQSNQSQMPCPMMTNDCPPLIQASTTTMTITEPMIAASNQINQQSLDVQAANQNHQLQQDILNSLNRMNNAENQLQNMEMAVDQTPPPANPSPPSSSSSSSNASTNQASPILDSAKLGSYCHHENKIDMPSINAANNLSATLNESAKNAQEVFMTSISSANIVAIETNKSNELMLSSQTSMITNQNQSMMTSSSNNNDNNNGNNGNNRSLLSTTIEHDDLTSAQSNIHPMSKMSDAELIVFIDPTTFD